MNWIESLYNRNDIQLIYSFIYLSAEVDLPGYEIFLAYSLRERVEKPSLLAASNLGANCRRLSDIIIRSRLEQLSTPHLNDVKCVLRILLSTWRSDPHFNFSVMFVFSNSQALWNASSQEILLPILWKMFYGYGNWKRFRRLVPTRAAVTRTIWMSQYDTKSRSPHKKSFSRRRVAGPQPTEAQMLIQWAYKRVQDERYPFECTSNCLASVTRGPLQESRRIIFNISCRVAVGLRKIPSHLKAAAIQRSRIGVMAATSLQSEEWYWASCKVEGD